jgi:hypothetical protein
MMGSAGDDVDLLHKLQDGKVKWKGSRVVLTDAGRVYNPYMSG